MFRWPGIRQFPAAVVLILAAASAGFAKDCVFELDKPEPYYILGSLVTPQSNSVTVDDCSKTIEQIKAEIEAEEKAKAEAEARARERAKELAEKETDNVLLQRWHEAREKARQEALAQRFPADLPVGSNVQPSGNSYVRENCSNQWGTDYEMVEYCQRNQIEAALNMQRIHASIAGDPVRIGILGNCIDAWPEGRGYDWEMVEYCYKNQNEAYLRLNR